MQEIQTKDIIRYITIGILFLVPLCALAVSDSMFFPYITGKNFLFRVLVELALVGWIVLAVIDTQYRPRFSWVAVAVAAFIVVMGVANAFGKNPYDSFWSNYERMEGYITMLHLAALFLVAYTTFTRERLWTWFFHISIGVSLIIGIGAVLSGTIVESGGALGNPIYLAIFSLFHAFLAGFYMLRVVGKNNMVAAAYGVVVVAELAIMIGTETRGTTLGLFAGIGIMALLLAIFERTRPRLRQIAAGVVILGVLGSAGFGWLLYANNADVAQDNPVVQTVNDTPLFGTLATIDLSGVNSATTRFYTAWMGLQGFTERPVLGWGQSNYSYVFSKYFMPEIHGREPWFDRAHNVFVDWLVQGGTLGFLAYMALWVALIAMLWRDPHQNWSLYEKVTVTGLLVAYFVHNIFVFDSITSYIIFFALLAYVGARTLRPDSRPLLGEKGAQPVIAYGVVAPLAVVLCGVVLYTATLQPMWASQSLIQGLSFANANRYEQSLAHFREAINYDTFGNQEIREQLSTTARQLESKNVSQDTKQQFLNFTHEQMQIHSAAFPDETRPHLFWGLMLMRYDKNEQAVQALERAHELSPTKPRIMLQLGNAYLRNGQYEKGAEIIKQVRELVPDMERAKVMHAMALRYQGKEEKVNEVLSSMSEEEILFNDRLLQPYAVTEQYGKLIDTRQKRLDILNKRLAEREKQEKSTSSVVQDIVQESVSLAAAYERDGEKGEAVRVIRDARDRFPRFESQLTNFIKQLEGVSTEKVEQ